MSKECSPMMMINYIITWKHILWSWIGDYPWFPIVLCRELGTNIAKFGPFLARGTWSRSNYYKCLLPPCPLCLHVIAAALCKLVGTYCPSCFGMSLPLYPITFFGQKIVACTCLWLIGFLTGPVIGSFHFGTLQND